MRPALSATSRFWVGMAAPSAARRTAARLPARANSPSPRFSAPGRWAVQRSASALPSDSCSRYGPHAASSQVSSTASVPATSIVSRFAVIGVHDPVAVFAGAHGATRYTAVLATYLFVNAHAPWLFLSTTSEIH